MYVYMYKSTYTSHPKSNWSMPDKVIGGTIQWKMWQIQMAQFHDSSFRQKSMIFASKTNNDTLFEQFLLQNAPNSYIR